MTDGDYKSIGIDRESLKNDPNWKTVQQGKKNVKKLI